MRKYRISFQYPGDYERGLGVVNTAEEAMKIMAYERRQRPFVKIWVKRFDPRTGDALPYMEAV